MPDKATDAAFQGALRMPSKFMEVLMLGRCSHEFSWPRRGPDGRYYQVCLLCAAEYNYDWKTMRRTERVDRQEPAEPGLRRSRGCVKKKASWVPRARRIRANVEVAYRPVGGEDWYSGTVENISQSGVRFRGEHLLDENTPVEMVFEMPQEITGQEHSKVNCKARVVRAAPPGQSENEGAMAASIVDYKFLHSEQDRAQSAHSGN